ncbi:hypothetical protein M378DRAFT_15905 [Amanita muscaria Koide BX008]|uniref:ATP-dependent DNA helicase n=1 Tax=Amanita muscaria (strain Koide BX008) TaxID=946122 RepID=A0A0C2WMK9_AMAMK|nr:hypothetical protein M378DRAFT_15905 [Amanita muscaria Koide BX008]
MKPYLTEVLQHQLADFTFQYVDHTEQKDQYSDLHYVHVDFPLHKLVALIPVSVGRKLADLHGMRVSSRATTALLQNHFLSHNCQDCSNFVSIFSVEAPKGKKMIPNGADVQGLHDLSGSRVEMTDEEKVHQKREQTKRRVHDFRERALTAADLEVHVDLTDEEKEQQKREQTRLRVCKYRERGIYVANLNAPVIVTDDEKAQQTRERTRLRVHEFRERATLAAVSDAQVELAVEENMQQKKKQHKTSIQSSHTKYEHIDGERKQHMREQARLRVQRYRQKDPVHAGKKSSVAGQKSEQSTGVSQTQSKAQSLMDNLVDVFPPQPLTRSLAHTIVTSACKKMGKKNIEEAGCAVCGQLTPLKHLSKLKSVKNILHVLEAPGSSRQERHCETVCIKEFPVVIDHSCVHICNPCRAALRQGKVPKYALAKGLWIGAVPEELSALRFVERMLVARVRHSCCAIRIASGMRKMKANAIAFRSPLPKVYDMLPPPKEDIEDILAIMFTGPCSPTAADFLRTPFLVRRNHVKQALNWLILNHADYADVKVSDSNLHSYPEDMPPVSVEFKQMESNKTPEGTSVFDIDEEDGTEEGVCSFTVHGLTGEQLNIMTTNTLKAKALHHLNSQGKFLAIGHDAHAESIWKNPHLYPQMFPWLFPYGLGGIGSVPSLAEHEHKRRLLMYHDKRFQTDPNFPFIAFSHEQVKTASSNSFLLAEKRIFDDISGRLLSIDGQALNSILERMSKDEFVEPITDGEKQCFQLIRDLDHVSGTVKGSNTSKKWMRNEIWSLVAHCGAPFWYITLSPADVKHPICLYYSGSDELFEPTILPYDERLRCICNNPVACARFFHFVVTTFVTDVLGVGTAHMGLYGQTKAYYGTVEQQGRLALHLHMMIWIKGNLTPQEMRNLLLDTNSDFQQKIVAWVESCQIGEFVTGTQEEVLQRVQEKAKSPDYKDPTETLPEAPPPMCSVQCKTCKKCRRLDVWWEQFEDTVDDIVSKSNIHNCDRGTNKDGSRSKKMMYVGCRANKYGTCKARFPRPTFKVTQIDPETGSLNLKKGEPWMNSITTYLTYIFRCNTDVTSMWSGTALKAVIVYISDYITKTGLKTHVIFDAIRSIFDKNRDILGSSLPEKEKARQLLNKMVNLLSTKAEMGAPMVCMYLLGNPDHYTSHKFVPFYWKSYVNEVHKAWDQAASGSTNDKVAIIKVRNRVIGLSPVYDYIYRPAELEDMCLYDFARRCERKRIPSRKSKSNTVEVDDDEDGELCGDIEEEEHGGAHELINDEENDETKYGNDTEHCTAFKLPRNTYKFNDKHPLVDTHAMHVKPDKDNIVVNFIGGILPRCDQGDRESYCLTMLTLFKSWRTGHSLKKSDSSWDETFEEHPFTARQCQLLKNFNIRYECLDARDDYRAQLRAGKVSPFFMFGDEDTGHDEDQLLEDCFVDPKGADVTEAVPHHLSSVLGTKELKQQREITDIRAVMRQTGWTNELCPYNANFSARPIIPEVNLAGSDWKAVVQLHKQKVLEERNKRCRPTDSMEKGLTCHSSAPNQVRIVDKSYLQRKYYTTAFEVSIDSICTNFQLNQEQERAFKIIAHHVVMPTSEQLKMYIGGMGGTGKSQVIKAICSFFATRTEAHRFISVAPTGTAAALLAGSTYHSVFGINDMNGNATEKVLTQVRTRLQGVDYVFLDEVSMLSCHDLYRISSQLSRVLNKLDQPFGGINIIFAGDFAQLPPPMGGEHVSLYSRTVGRLATSLRSQEEAMGRAVWHQVTTVVILWQNMRQRVNTDEDNKLRRALENMRYKDCTPEDLLFLKSRVTSLQAGRPSICDPKFRNVSIITAKNIQKDEINRLGCIKFSQETGQELTQFYSEDTLKSTGNDNVASRKKSTRKISRISDELQQVIWNLPHSSADKQVPGKLSLCLGLPVLLKCNVATELCITNGQEATVVGWQSTLGSRNQLLLDTLFVKLVNPPTCVALDGLPQNVVPLTCTTSAITCRLPDDSKISLSRSQVEVLPNFAMTDFASQGKTRPYNPVDLFNCRSHQAYYTALSRSATAEGTVILQGFDARKITGKASGALRQELRDLELLDEITKLKYESKLLSTICGDRRNTLIHAYRTHKGMSYVPSIVHHSIRWNKSDPMLDPVEDDVHWKIVQKSDVIDRSKHSSDKDCSFVPAKGSVPLNAAKRKLSLVDSTEDKPAKKIHAAGSSVSEKDTAYSISTTVPSGFSWHHNSCAYDSVSYWKYVIEFM